MLTQKTVPKETNNNNNDTIPIGYSNIINTPEFKRYVKKTANASFIFSLILIPLPLIGFTAYSKITDKMEIQEAISIGSIVSAIFLIFAIYSFLKTKMAKPYEAIVENKMETQERYHKNSDVDNKHIMYYTKYTIIARTTDGQKKKIIETSKSPTIAWDYMQIGDKFQFHPNLGWPYELYDKNTVNYIPCSICRKKNKLSDTHCQKCNAPLLR